MCICKLPSLAQFTSTVSMETKFAPPPRMGVNCRGKCRRSPPPPPLTNYIQFCRCIEPFCYIFHLLGGGVSYMWGPFSYFSSYEGHFSLCGGRFCPYGWPCLGSPLSLQKYSLVPMTPPLTQIVKSGE